MRCSEPPVLMLGPGGAFSVAFHDDSTGDQIIPKLRRSWSEPGGHRPSRPDDGRDDPAGRLLLLAGYLSIAERALARQPGLLAHARSALAGLARRAAGVPQLQW